MVFLDELAYLGFPVFTRLRLQSTFLTHGRSKSIVLSSSLIYSFHAALSGSLIFHSMLQITFLVKTAKQESVKLVIFKPAPMDKYNSNIIEDGV